MARWSTSEKEYERARQACFEATVCGGQLVLVTMSKGPVLTGWLVGSTQRAGVRVTNEQVERIGMVWGEITLQSLEGDELTLDAIDVASIRLARK